MRLLISALNYDAESPTAYAQQPDGTPFNWMQINLDGSTDFPALWNQPLDALPDNLVNSNVMFETGVTVFGQSPDTRNFFGTIETFSIEVAAVPETSTWFMLLLGFAGVGFMTFRRSRKFGTEYLEAGE